MKPSAARFTTTQPKPFFPTRKMSSAQPSPTLTTKGFHSAHEKMTFFHDGYRIRFEILQKDVKNLKTDSEVQNFRKLCQDFVNDLDTHHKIEELHVFPVLAAKMPEFKSSMLDEHKDLVSSLHKLSDLSQVLEHSKVNLEEWEVVMSEVRKTLFSHLAEEEKLLEAENMKKYWTLEEINQFKFV